MAETITLELPDTLARRAREVASRTNRRLEEVLIDWLYQVETEPPVESLSDDQILALCDMQMETGHNEELSDLLARNREGQLNEAEQQRLDELMQVYRAGLRRKAQALKVAVERKLRSPLN
jgi:hypothetical protein